MTKWWNHNGHFIMAFEQYLSALNNYNSAIDYFTTVPKYRIQAVQYCKQEGISLPSENAKRKKDKNKTKV